jgi:hypothetical protein
MAVGPPQKFLTLQIPLRSSEKKFGPPNSAAKLRKKIWPSKLRYEAPKKNLELQIAPRSSKKKFGAPNSAAELQKKIWSYKFFCGGLEFFPELQIRRRSVARPGTWSMWSARAAPRGAVHGCGGGALGPPRNDCASQTGWWRPLQRSGGGLRRGRFQARRRDPLPCPPPLRGRGSPRPLQTKHLFGDKP